jgi:hypothetical protein
MRSTLIVWFFIASDQLVPFQIDQPQRFIVAQKFGDLQKRLRPEAVSLKL